ncbi:C6 transcription factor Prf [Gaeumannomyces tritici R3-111a-1]|uniref:C6 transcription factor Prf n=1 Tax=Gaeumannomyces tritici (strain R3-111a-1) TaxID=644352 RepID=J3PKF1_GAET3|nr:C6 transcription factor Prf [Gaeumannomyces tritici R3-111a-1]EJT68416.1 C6 transcription factor Prf [Gaeumannomyces tritici R3-111a-1]
MSSSSNSPPDASMGNDAASGPCSASADSVPLSATADNTSVPKPKRLACMICRKRKLKCDGQKPSCSTCTRLGHSCAYDEIRRKSGPKRGYVKALEERLKQVETLLKTQDHSPVSASETAPKSATAMGTATRSDPTSAAARGAFGLVDPSISAASKCRDVDGWQFTPDSPQQPAAIDDFGFNSSIGMNMADVGNTFTWEMIGLGLEEPLPPQETIDELHQTYFEKIHPSLPMIHRYRYLAAMNLAPNQRPPVCLRYAMWTLACSVSDKYSDLKDLFYQRARKYIEADYVKGFGEQIIRVAHTQTHILLASYELKMMFFPRAWMSTGSAVRLAQMIGLHRLDGASLDVKQCLPPPRDWTEKEERRRTFWMAFCEDRYASIGTGWPMAIDEKDIMTNLPASDEAFDMSRPEQTLTLTEAMSPSGAAKLNAFGGIVLMACLFGRNLIHLHRPDEGDNDHDLNGEFWKRHRAMDNILLNTSLCLPQQLKLPLGIEVPNVVYTNMCIHTSTICLHQAAIFKADKNRLPPSVSAESKVRCIAAATEIARIMRMVSHMDLTAMNPFLSFCLYVSSRVFVQYLKSKPDDSQSADSLRFLLAAMNALKRRNPLTESFLVQLDVDLEALTTRMPKLKGAFVRNSDSPSSSGLPNQSGNVARGVVCEEHDKGLLYRNECHFFRTAEDNGNPTDAPDITNADGSREAAAAAVNALAAGSWLSPDSQIPSRDRGQLPEISLTPTSQGVLGSRSTGSMSGFGQSDNGDTGDMATTPNTGASNQPTPNSSTPSEQRQGSLGAIAGARSSFDASPVSPHQGAMTSQAEMEPGAGAFFGQQQGFAMAPDISMISDANADDFSVTPDWGMSGQTDMAQGAEGVLRSIMQMAPMETMDLGWSSNP